MNSPVAPSRHVFPGTNLDGSTKSFFRPAVKTARSKTTVPRTFSKFDHAQARLKWARATRDTKIEKIREVRSEIEALRKAMDVKAIEIKMLKVDREAANKRVQTERNAYREELVEVTGEVENQLDSRILEGYSSDVAHMRSSPFTEISYGDDVEKEGELEVNGKEDTGAATPSSVTESSQA